MVQQILVALVGLGIVLYILVRVVRIFHGHTPGCTCGCEGCENTVACSEEKKRDKKTGKNK